MTEPAATPRTDALIQRHADESTEAQRCRTLDIHHSIRQTKELIHHTQELERELTSMKDSLDRCDDARIKAEQELDGLRTFKRSVDEALNSGDGGYRP